MIKLCKRYFENLAMLLTSLQLTNVVGNLAVVTTIIQFLSGVLVCKQYVRNNSTGEASALPFLLGITSTLLWLLYGSIKADNKIIFVNSVGLVLMSAYVIVFYKYAYKRKVLLRQILICAVCGMLLFGYLKTEEDVKKLQNNIGFVACCLTLLTVAAPLDKLCYVIKVKSTECLPYHMIVMSFFVSAIWMVYGCLKEDPYLIVPNIIGAMLAVAQLSLFVIYSSHRHLQSVKTIQA